MPDPRWSSSNHAYHLGEAYAASQGEDDRNTDPVTFEEVARELDADPELLEAAWEAWHEEMDVEGWTEKQVNEARYWLDVVVIGDLTNP